MASDHDIRAGIKAVIEDAAPLAVVFPWWCLGFDQGRWPAILRSADDQNRPHGWVITRTAIARTDVPGGLFDKRPTYAIWGFHYYLTGTESDNSEKLFQAELDAVADALTPGSVAGVTLTPLQFPLIQIGRFGEELLHWAQGQIIGEFCG